MWQVLILIGIILALYLMGKIVKKPSKSIDGVQTEMVKCSSCSLNIPKADAYRKNDLWYCKKEN